VVAFGVALVLLAALVAAVVLYRPFVAFDEALSASVRSWQSPGLDSVFRALTHLGDFWLVVAAAALLAGVLVLRRRPAEATFVFLSVVSGMALGHLLQELVERARPGLELARIPVPDAYSFPSGHALASFLFLGALFFVVALEARGFAARAWVLAGCFVLAGLVAFSRVFLGVHWFGDVLASWIVGSGWLTLCASGYFAMTSGERPT
jgi:undecaprenyl-diphosphatase